MNRGGSQACSTCTVAVTGKQANIADLGRDLHQLVAVEVEHAKAGKGADLRRDRRDVVVLHGEHPQVGAGCDANRKACRVIATHVQDAEVNQRRDVGPGPTPALQQHHQLKGEMGGGDEA